MERRTYRSLTGEQAHLEHGPGQRAGRKPLICRSYVRPLVQHREPHGAGVATLETYKDEGIFERVRENERHFEEVLHGCRDLPRVKDVRNMGLMGAVELEPFEGAPGKRGFEAMIACYEAGLMTRIAMDTFEFSPPLIAERSHLDQIFETFRSTLRSLG
jgi:beta-alanine--pyruvate transaminase